MLAQSMMMSATTIVSPDWPYMLPGLVFAFCFGACVGSFLNVIVYRLPEGMSIISPPSRCPTCGGRLRWTENLPIIGWWLVRGRCRRCGIPISPQYMIVELGTALLFLFVSVVFYVVQPGEPWWTQLGGAWWYHNGFLKTWPAFVAILFMLSALVAMALIDARTFTIPIELPTFVTISAFVLLPLQSLFHAVPRQGQVFAMPLPDALWSMTAFGGMAGVIVALVLLKKGILRLSFADYEAYLKDDEPLADYPHARREMGVELVYLLPIMGGLLAGLLTGFMLKGTELPLFMQALGGVSLGYLVGGAVIWTVRILGTLAFGREAMGIGDVHLLASVGAVLGWHDPIWILFVASFVGIFWTLLSLILSVFGSFRRELPLGPHLAVGTLIMLHGDPLVDLARLFIGW